MVFKVYVNHNSLPRRPSEKTGNDVNSFLASQGTFNLPHSLKRLWQSYFFLLFYFIFNIDSAQENMAKKQNLQRAMFLKDRLTTSAVVPLMTGFAGVSILRDDCQISLLVYFRSGNSTL